MFDTADQSFICGLKPYNGVQLSSMRLGLKKRNWQNSKLSSERYFPMCTEILHPPRQCGGAADRGSNSRVRGMTPLKLLIGLHVTSIPKRITKRRIQADDEWRSCLQGRLFEFR